MAKLTDTRIEAIALTLAKAIDSDPELTVPNKGLLTRRIRQRLEQATGSDPGLDEAVRRRIQSLSREVPEGSAEWDVLYRQYSLELARRR